MKPITKYLEKGEKRRLRLPCECVQLSLYQRAFTAVTWVLAWAWDFWLEMCDSCSLARLPARLASSFFSFSQNKSMICLINVHVYHYASVVNLGGFLQFTSRRG